MKTGKEFPSACIRFPSSPSIVRRATRPVTPAAIRNADCDRRAAAIVVCAQPVVTEAVFLFGEIAQCFGEWKHRFGRAIQFHGVTKLGCRNGAMAWANAAVRAVRSRGVLGASQPAGIKQEIYSPAFLSGSPKSGSISFTRN